VTAKQKTRCKFIVQLGEKKRDRPNTLIRNGKHVARKMLKARAWWQANASDAGAGRNDRGGSDTSRPGVPVSDRGAT
jgi:hypothetical protein